MATVRGAVIRRGAEKVPRHGCAWSPGPTGSLEVARIAEMIVHTERQESTMSNLFR